MVEGPRRFSNEICRAATAVEPEIGPASFRQRFRVHHIIEKPELIPALARILRRGNNGI